jgi:hypothetical protein
MELVDGGLVQETSEKAKAQAPKNYGKSPFSIGNSTISMENPL